MSTMCVTAGLTSSPILCLIWIDGLLYKQAPFFSQSVLHFVFIQSSNPSAIIYDESHFPVPHFVLSLEIDIGCGHPTLVNIFNGMKDHDNTFFGKVQWPMMTDEELAGACGGAQDDKEGEKYTVLQVVVCRFMKHYVNGTVTEIPFNQDDIEDAKDRQTIEYTRGLYQIFYHMRDNKDRKMMEAMRSCGRLMDGIRDRANGGFYRYVSDCHKVFLHPSNKPVAWIVSCDIIKHTGQYWEP